MPSLTYSVADQDFQRTKSLGIFHLSLGLLEQLAARWDPARLAVLSNDSLVKHLERALAPQVTRYECNQATKGRLHRLLWDQWQVYQAAQRAKGDWLFLPKGFASFCCSCPTKLAAYVHDAMHDYYARHIKPNPLRWESWYFQRCLLATLKQSRIVFTNSEFTAAELRRIAENHGLTKPRIHPVGMGFSRPQRPGTERENRIIALASRWPHKRSDLVVNYLDRWQRETGYIGCVDIIGSISIPFAGIAHPRWRWHNRLPGMEFQEKLARARLVVFFSDYEGFGMPPVEAALAGACPVYSDIPATREVMRGCGFAFDNESFGSFDLALRQALAVSADQIDRWAEQLMLWHNWASVVAKVQSALLDEGTGHWD